jgi:hypothetical protein
MATSARLRISLAIAVVGLVLDWLTPLGLATWLSQLVVVWFTGRWAARREILTVAVVCSSFILAGLWLSAPSHFPIWISTVNRVIVVTILWLLVRSILDRGATDTTLRKTESELKEASTRIQVLSGLLPICAACKKIRNEADEWEQLETYIHDHSEAEFTHSLCDECIARLYPDCGPRA